MRIILTSTDVVITDQLRTYAEYRLFTSIARHGRAIRALHLSLRLHAAGRDRLLCLVVADLHASGPLRAEARAGHPTLAIDRVADQLGSLLGGSSPDSFERE